MEYVFFIIFYFVKLLNLSHYFYSLVLMKFVALKGENESELYIFIDNDSQYQYYINIIK